MSLAFSILVATTAALEPAIMHTENLYHQPANEILVGKYSTQHHAGECRWIERDRDGLLAALASPTPPAFRTVLSMTQAGDDGKPTHSLGGFYADFDGDLDETIGAFHAFLSKLVEHGVSLDQVRLYATGGRGFHCEIPMQCFVIEIPAGGVVDLHRVFKEMAFGLYVDTLDLRVYSSRRMWRTPNVQRSNNLYKVPLSTAEALAITPATYAHLCSEPRPHAPLAPPTLAPRLAALYLVSRDKLSVKALRRAPGKAAAALTKRFRGALNLPLPPSLIALGRGDFPAREGAGWNGICMQLTTTAQALGTSEDDLVTLCRKLIDNHAGDGHRYGTPGKRERELRRMYAVTEGGSYEASAGGIRSILPRSIPANDLRGV